MTDPIDPTRPDLPPSEGGPAPTEPWQGGPTATTPTEAMPTVPSAAAGEGLPGTAGFPATETYEEYGLDEQRPWYTTSWGLFGIIVVAAVLLGGLAWLIWGGNDSEPDPDAVRVELSVIDADGSGLDRGIIATVVGPADSPNAFTWIEPEGATGSETGGPTGDDGRIAFAWVPDDTVDEPQRWESQLTLVEAVPAGFVPPGPTVDCVLQRPDAQSTTISMNVVADPPDTSVDQVVTYSFPNHVFLPGDLVTCQLVSTASPTMTSTTVPETTVPETTVPETTVPETTVPETTVPESTVPETTTPPETTEPETTTTVAPAPATATEALQAAGDFGTFLSLVGQVPDVQDLLDGSDPVTVFAPTDDALAGVTPPDDPAELEQLLRSHIVEGDALDAASVFDGRTSLDMSSGGSQPVDVDAATVGEVPVTQPDIASGNGFSHGISALLPVATS